jgi:hypothetical protein
MILRRTSFRAFALLLIALVISVSAARAATVTRQVWLLVSADSLDSVLSTDTGERDALIKGNWKLSGTGTLEVEAQPGTVPIRRLFRPGTSATDRILETDPAQVAAHVKAGFNDEGILGYAATQQKPGSVPIHHFTKDGKHFYAIDAGHQSKAEQVGWSPAGVAFWLGPVKSGADKASSAGAKK